MPNYRYNTPDYMRQNNSNGCHVGGSRTMPASMFHGRSGVLSMKLKKDSDVELFLRN